jgi:predicted class III extradiol MEMO1 family dioxygenase
VLAFVKNTQASGDGFILYHINQVPAPLPLASNKYEPLLQLKPKHHHLFVLAVDVFIQHHCVTALGTVCVQLDIIQLLRELDIFSATFFQLANV